MMSKLWYSLDRGRPGHVLLVLASHPLELILLALEVGLDLVTLGLQGRQAPAGLAQLRRGQTRVTRVGGAAGDGGEWAIASCTGLAL